MKNLFSKKDPQSAQQDQQSHQKEESMLSVDDFDLVEVLATSRNAKYVAAKPKARLQLPQLPNGLVVLRICHKDRLLNNDREHLREDFERVRSQAVNCACLVQLEAFFETDTKSFIVARSYDGLSLDRCLSEAPGKTIPIAEVKSIAASICCALLHLHANGESVYGDLGPGKVLVESGRCRSVLLRYTSRAKGVMRVMQNYDASPSSPFYVPPECLSGQDHEMTSAVDWWQFGVLLFNMVCGRQPFVARRIQDLFKVIATCPQDEHERRLTTVLREQDAPDDVTDLIVRCLCKDPQKRITGNEVKAHRFFCGFNWVSLC